MDGGDTNILSQQRIVVDPCILELYVSICKKMQLYVIKNDCV